MTTALQYYLDKTRPRVCQVLPQTAREMLVTAYLTPDPKTRAVAIDTTTDLIRKKWPEYFQRVG